MKSNRISTMRGTLRGTVLMGSLLGYGAFAQAVAPPVVQEKSPSSQVEKKEAAAEVTAKLVEIKWENGQLKARGQMLGHKRIGLWQFWDKQGNLHQELPFVDGAIQGEVKGYFPNGKLKIKTVFVDGRENGESIQWHTNGRMKTKTQFKNGVKEGHYQAWGNNGAPLVDAHYVDGKLHGAYQAWDEKGNLQVELIYENGVEKTKK
jgi:antitoxin component YwqK of YwqJK toxin-antitoxin module